jgi:hypothetical protein
VWELLDLARGLVGVGVRWGAADQPKLAPEGIARERVQSQMPDSEIGVLWRISVLGYPSLVGKQARSSFGYLP